MAMKNLVLIFALLMTLVCCTTEADRERMRALLDRADSMNRAYIPMTDGIDSLLLEATRFYDRHGDANQQLRAHYLLGCAYRDMGEAPAALQSYQDAIDRADTLSPDCDYRRLMSVYGQMAELFHAQNLPEDELVQRTMIGKYALLTDDTLYFIRNLELLVKPYFLMKDNLSMLRVLQQAHDLYLSNGYTKEAAATFGPVIDYHIAKGQMDKADSLMKVYELQSGLFDSEGNIAAGREMYYYIKGMYFLKRHDLLLAERWFRRMPASEYKDACKGLLSVFRLQHNYDSVAKYAYLYENALDSLHDHMQTETTHQMSSLYNYHRFQREKVEEAEKTRHLREVIYFILAAIVTGIVVFWYLWSKHKMAVKAKTDKLLAEYSTAKLNYQNLLMDYALAKKEINGLQVVCREVESLKQSNETLHDSLKNLVDERDNLLSRKEVEIAALKEQLVRKENALRNKNFFDQYVAFSSSAIVMKLREKCSPESMLKPKVSNREWFLLHRQFISDMPLCSNVMFSRAALTFIEKNICVLLLLDFKHDEIMRLLNATSQSVTNFKSNANKKLFKSESALSLQSNLRSLLSL